MTAATDTLTAPTSVGDGIAHFDDLRAVAASSRLFVTQRLVHDSAQAVELATQVCGAMAWLIEQEATVGVDAVQAEHSGVEVSVCPNDEWSVAEFVFPRAGISMAEAEAFITELSEVGVFLDAAHTAYESALTGDED